MISGLFLVLLILGCADKTQIGPTSDVSGDNDAGVSGSDDVGVSGVDNIPSASDNLLLAYLKDVKLMPEYIVEYESSYSSSGGARRWEIRYGLKDEEYVSCSGMYQFSGQGEDVIKICTLKDVNKDDPPFGKPMKMSDVINEAKSIADKPMKLISIDDRDCFYIKQDESNTLLCFNKEKVIVNLVKKGGYGGFQAWWKVVGYGFTQDMRMLVG